MRFLFVLAVALLSACGGENDPLVEVPPDTIPGLTDSCVLLSPNDVPYQCSFTTVHAVWCIPYDGG